MPTTDYAKIADDETIAQTQKALEANHFIVKVVDTLEQAKAEVLAMVPEGSEIFTATSVTTQTMGLPELFNESGKYDSIRQKIAKLAEQGASDVEKRRMGSAADYAVGSVQAISQDGHVVIASQGGSQMPSYVYGANHVIWVVGSQKITANEQEAIKRIEEHVLPLEDERALAAYGSGSTLSKLLIFRHEIKPRTTIILVKEAAGY